MPDYDRADSRHRGSIFAFGFYMKSNNKISRLAGVFDAELIPNEEEQGCPTMTELIHATKNRDFR